MKKLLYTALILLSVANLCGCQQKADTTDAAQIADSQPVQLTAQEIQDRQEALRGIQQATADYHRSCR